VSPRCALYKYRIGLVEVPFDDDPPGPREVVGAGWRASLAPPLHWRELEKKRVDGGHRVAGGRAVEIEAPSFDAAYRALHLILAAIDVGIGEPPFHDPSRCIPFCQDDPESVTAYDSNPRVWDSYVATAGIWEAVEMAARASRRRTTQYALFKYQFSLSCHGNLYMDLDPSRGRFLPISCFPVAHMRLAFAILAAHSSLEDLDLEIRASSQKPSRLRNGEWNPVVKEELESRLTAAGVDLTEPVVWAIRGTAKRRLDAWRKVRTLPTKYSWSRGWVRDAPVQVVDAIAHFDWLRDKVAAHGGTNFPRGLSPYDVANAQHLSRRLILKTLNTCRRRRKRRHREAV